MKQIDNPQPIEDLAAAKTARHVSLSRMSGFCRYLVFCL